MSTLIMTVNCNQDGILYYDYPPGCPAIELGYQGVIQVNLGSGYNGDCQFDRLTIWQGGTSYDLDVTKKNAQPVTATFPNGAIMYLYNNLRLNMYIRNDGQDPVSGEDDMHFSLWISDNSGVHILDPEIRVRSGTGSGTAIWVPDNTAQPDVVVRKAEEPKELRG